MRVMIVDDSRAQRMMLRRMVETLGFETEEAEHGQDALDKLQADDPVDLMLVDWNMPVLDGLDMLKAVRKQGAYADTTIMMVSSESDPRKIARALMCGADDYLVKPVDAPMIREKLIMLGVLEPETV